MTRLQRKGMSRPPSRRGRVPGAAPSDAPETAVAGASHSPQRAGPAPSGGAGPETTQGSVSRTARLHESPGQPAADPGATAERRAPHGRLAEHLATGYFACVMATAIVSIALFLHGYGTISLLFFILAAACYAWLIVLYLYRLWRYPWRVWADLTDARTVFGYFTFIAGTDVLGTRFALAQQEGVALGLGLVGLVSWGALTYFVLMVLLFSNQEPIERAINGSWLITTVSCESLAALGSALADARPQAHVWLLFVAYAFWSLGVILYLIFIAMIMYRFFFFAVTSRDLSPPYWINMGAMAITTLAGSRLVLYPHATAFLLVIRPFVQGFTLMLWVWGTWWIPFLVLIGLWKYGVWRDRVGYDPALWSIVFPLGMYTVACETLGRIAGLQLVQSLVTPFLWIAVAAWGAVAVLFLWQWMDPRLLRAERL